MNKSDIDLQWIDYCSGITSNWDICAAGINILWGEEDMHEYYFHHGFQSLFASARAHVEGR